MSSLENFISYVEKDDVLISSHTSTLTKYELYKLIETQLLYMIALHWELLKIQTCCAERKSHLQTSLSLRFKPLLHEKQ